MTSCRDPRYDKNKPPAPKPIISTLNKIVSGPRLTVSDGFILHVRNAIAHQAIEYKRFSEFGEFMMKGGTHQQPHTFNFGLARVYMLSKYVSLSKNYWTFEKEWRQLFASSTLRPIVKRIFERLSFKDCNDVYSKPIPKMFPTLPHNGWQLNYGHAGHLHNDTTVNPHCPTVLMYLGTFKTCKFMYYPYANTIADVMETDPVILTISPGDIVVFDAKYYHVGRAEHGAARIPRDLERARNMHDAVNTNRISVVFMADALWGRTWATKEQRQKILQSMVSRLRASKLERAKHGLLGQTCICKLPGGKVVNDADAYMYKVKNICRVSYYRAQKLRKTGRSQKKNT